MIRYFCYLCDTEISAQLVTSQPNLVADVHLETGPHKVSFKISRALDGGPYNADHVCGYCLGMAFRDLAITVEKMQSLK